LALELARYLWTDGEDYLLEIEVAEPIGVEALDFGRMFLLLHTQRVLG
jgi:hypothetical protein